MGMLASVVNARGIAASCSSSAKAMVGTIGPDAVAICRHSMREEDSLTGGPGSAMITADGLTDTKAVGASAHLVSTMGKAPASPSASTRAVAGLSATTINGP